MTTEQKNGLRCELHPTQSNLQLVSAQLRLFDTAYLSSPQKQGYQSRVADLRQSLAQQVQTNPCTSFKARCTCLIPPNPGESKEEGLRQKRKLNFSNESETQKAKSKVKAAFDYLQWLAQRAKPQLQSQISVIKEVEAGVESNSLESNNSCSDENDSLQSGSSESSKYNRMEQKKIPQLKFQEEEKKDKKGQVKLSGPINYGKRVSNLDFIVKRRNTKVTSIQELFNIYNGDPLQGANAHGGESRQIQQSIKNLASNLNKISQELESTGAVTKEDRQPQRAPICLTTRHKGMDFKWVPEEEQSTFSDEIFKYKHKKQCSFRKQTSFKATNNTGQQHRSSAMSCFGESIRSLTKHKESLDVSSLKGICLNIRKLTQDLFEVEDEKLSIKSKERIRHVKPNTKSADKICIQVKRQPSREIKTEEDYFKIVLKEANRENDSTQEDQLNFLEGRNQDFAQSTGNQLLLGESELEKNAKLLDFNRSALYKTQASFDNVIKARNEKIQVQNNYKRINMVYMQEESHISNYSLSNLNEYNLEKEEPITDFEFNISLEKDQFKYSCDADGNSNSLKINTSRQGENKELLANRRQQRKHTLDEGSFYQKGQQF